MYPCVSNNDAGNKLQTLQSNCGTIRLTFEGGNKGTMLQLYKKMVVPALLYGCENWTLLKQQERRTETAEKKFVNSAAGCTLNGHETSTLQN